MYEQDDREYDREIARQMRSRRARGDESPLPAFAVPITVIDVVIEQGRENLGHPGSWPERVACTGLDNLSSVDDEAEDETCAAGLHDGNDLNASGHCRRCHNLWRRRRRAEEAGRPLCWAGEHPAPEPGLICPCGDPPPEETHSDWAVVFRAVDGWAIPRAMTPAEEMCSIRTAQLRFGLGFYEAASYVGLPTQRAKDLIYKWQPRTGYQAKSVDELIDDDYADQTTAGALTPAAA